MSDVNPCLTNTDRGFTISYGNRQLYSPTDPIAAAERRAENSVIPDQAVVFVPSPLLFYGIDVLIKKLPPSSTILCVETDQKLFSLSLKNCGSEIVRHPFLRYVRTSSKEKLFSVLEEMDISRFRKAVMVRLSRGFSLTPELYRDMFTRIEQEIGRYWQNRMTMIYMSKLWFKNLFKNLETLHSAHALELLTIKKPVVVAGAGESLEGSIELLKSIRKYIHLLAVDTAVPALRGCSLYPDSVCVVEAQSINIKDFIGFLDYPLTIFYDLTSFPTLNRVLPGLRYPFLSEFSHASLFSRMEAAGLFASVLPPLGSVGVIALYLALKITSQPVFFTGLDFSYTLGKPHCRGALSAVEILRRTNRLVPPNLFTYSLNRPLLTVTDKNGSPARTDIILYSYVKELRDIVAEERSVYDLGNRGLSTGAYRLCTKDEVMERIHAAESRRDSEQEKLDDSRFNPPPVYNSAAGRSTLKNFLTEEIAFIESFIQAGTSSLKKQVSANDRPAMINKLCRVDYIYSFFPDAAGVEQADNNFVKRALLSAYDFRSILRHVADHL